MLRIDLCSWQNGFIHLSLEFVLFLVLFFSIYRLLLEKLQFFLVLPPEVMLLVLSNSEVLFSNISIFPLQRASTITSHLLQRARLSGNNWNAGIARCHEKIFFFYLCNKKILECQGCVWLLLFVEKFSSKGLK